MTSTAVRRTALVASAAALALLATACGGSSDGDGGTAGDEPAGAERSASADASAGTGDALTAAELEKVALAQADVENGKVVTKVPADDDVAKDKIETDDEACLPLVHAQAAVAQGEAAADVKRSWTGQDESPSASAGPDGQDMIEIQVNKILLNVASYADGGAEQALKGLNAAAEKCAGGFTATVGSDEMRIAKVTTSAAPEGGDEAFAATLGVATGADSSAPMKVVVVRKGSTLASFSVVNLSSMVTGDDFEVPAAVVDAQVAKLG